MADVNQRQQTTPAQTVSENPAAARFQRESRSAQRPTCCAALSAARRGWAAVETEQEDVLGGGVSLALSEAEHGGR